MAEGPTTREHKKEHLKARAAVITLSNTRKLEDDESGNIVQELLEKDGHKVVERKILPDDAAKLEKCISGLLGKVDLIITSGGTGLAKDDITVEVVEKLFDKRITAFSSLFTTVSYEDIGAAAMLSRATAGLAKGTAIFSIPGSPKACRLALGKIILPEIGHVLKHAKE